MKSKGRQGWKDWKGREKVEDEHEGIKTLQNPHATYPAHTNSGRASTPG